MNGIAMPARAVVGERAVRAGETPFVWKEDASLNAFVRRHKEFLQTQVAVIVSARVEVLDGRGLRLGHHIEPKRRPTLMYLLECVAEHCGLQVLCWPVFAPHPCGSLEVHDGVIALVVLAIKRRLFGDDHVKFAYQGF